MEAWLRVSVLAVMTTIFAVPIVVIVKSRTIREDPVVILVLNMTIILFSFSCVTLVSFISDLLTENSPPILLCSVLTAFGLSMFGGFKLSTFFLAIEQYIAVVFTLRRYQLMSRWVSTMVSLNWVYIIAFASFSAASGFFGFKTVADFHLHMFGMDHQDSKCGSWKNGGIVFFAIQASSILLSIATYALLVYTNVLCM